MAKMEPIKKIIQNMNHSKQNGVYFALLTVCCMMFYLRTEKTQPYDQEYRTEVSEQKENAVRKVFLRSELSSNDVEYLRSMGKHNLFEKFKPIFTEPERRQVMDAIKVLTDALDAANITYFMYGGTLIGSWRHHGIVPWDDDLDIIVNISSWEALEKLKFQGYILNVQTLNRYKFYSKEAADIPGYFWKWPYIDICFFGDNGTHIFDMDPTFSKIYNYKKDIIFPLKKRPFGSVWLNSPKDAKKVIENNYKVNECQTRSYDHKRQRSIPENRITTVDCTLLHRLFPFVIRSDTRAETERLYLDRMLINTLEIRT